MDMNDTPLECGLDAFVSFNPDIEYLGKEVLEKQQQQGITRSLVGIMMDLKEISVTQHLPILNGENQIGTLRSACYSPDFGQCLGIAMIDKTHQTLDQDLKLQINDIEISTKMTSLPFAK